jgi:hypothetical protein
MASDSANLTQLRKSLAAVNFVIGSGTTELPWIANSGIQGRICWISKPGRTGIQFAIWVGLEMSQRAVPQS